MGLLQIGSNTKEKCGGRVAGIDLGTTYSLVSVVQDGSPRVLNGKDGKAALPSVVWFGPSGTVEVGEAARTQAADRAQDTIASAKRFMGRSQVESEQDDALTPYRFSSEQDGPVVYFELSGSRRVTPMEVSAEVLKELKRRAEETLGGALEGVVITVPAYFDDAQRQATKDAARLAGLNTLRLLNEPTAAALAYGLDNQKEGLFAVFDLGGGTFDISILKLEEGVFQVLATGGDSRLGGDDFDRAVAEYFLEKQGIDPKTCDAGQASSALSSARSAKEALTSAESVQVEISGESFALSRTLFDEIIEPILARVKKPVRRVLRDCGVAGEELNGVVLVGGSTRVPSVRAFVEALFGQVPLSDLDPDQVVSLGAAVQADMLGGSGPRSDVLLLDVLPLSLGIETMGGAVEKILHRNQAIPATAAQEFTTYADNQTGMDIHVLQGEREMVADCRSLARFKLSGLPPAAAGMGRVQVVFNVDADGILHVSAEEKESSTSASVQVKPSYGLDDATIEKMILDSLTSAEADFENRLLADTRVEAQRILNALDVALSEDGGLLSDQDSARFDRSIADLKQAIEGRSHSLIREKIDALDAMTADFAVARMNKTLGAALSGQRPDDVVR